MKEQKIPFDMRQVRQAHGLKKGRFGTFFACTGYPECNTTRQIGGTQKVQSSPLLRLFFCIPGGKSITLLTSGRPPAHPPGRPARV